MRTSARTATGGTDIQSIGSQLDRLKERLGMSERPRVEVVYWQVKPPEHALRHATNDELARLRVLATAAQGGRLTEEGRRVRDEIWTAVIERYAGLRSRGAF